MYGDLWAWFDLAERWADRRIREVELWLLTGAITKEEAEKLLRQTGRLVQVTKLQAVLEMADNS